jgi:hypothetical protein
MLDDMVSFSKETPMSALMNKGNSVLLTVEMDRHRCGRGDTIT